MRRGAPAAAQLLAATLVLTLLGGRGRDEHERGLVGTDACFVRPREFENQTLLALIKHNRDLKIKYQGGKLHYQRFEHELKCYSRAVLPAFRRDHPDLSQRLQLQPRVYFDALNHFSNLSQFCAHPVTLQRRFGKHDLLTFVFLQPEAVPDDSYSRFEREHIFGLSRPLELADISQNPGEEYFTLHGHCKVSSPPLATNYTGPHLPVPFWLEGESPNEKQYYRDKIIVRYIVDNAFLPSSKRLKGCSTLSDVLRRRSSCPAGDYRLTELQAGKFRNYLTIADNQHWLPMNAAPRFADQTAAANETLCTFHRRGAQDGLYEIKANCKLADFGAGVFPIYEGIGNIVYHLQFEEQTRKTLESYENECEFAWLDNAVDHYMLHPQNRPVFNLLIQ